MAKGRKGRNGEGAKRRVGETASGETANGRRAIDFAEPMTGGAKNSARHGTYATYETDGGRRSELPTANR